MEALEIEDLLSIATGDIVGQRKHWDIVRGLLSGPVGAWRSLSNLDPAGRMERALRDSSQELAPRVVDGLRLTWTPNPDSGSSEDESFVAILFFYGRGDVMWSSVALFNRTLL
ncbi:hypothetical protein ACLESO_50660 [Pyxidicoccus sp. 3LG]